MQTDLFGNAVREIVREYDALHHVLGWRFLCVSSANLHASTEIALITANPGGTMIPKDHPQASCEDGPAYLVERWGNCPPGASKLQRQVQGLFKTIAMVRGLGENAGPSVLGRSLIAYFIPFRSPRLAQLRRRDESLAFATRLWSGLFGELRPKLIVTIDRDTYPKVGSILQTVKGAHRVSTAEVPTGWGQYTASIDEYRGRDYETMLVRLPHLSTFQLFTSARCRQQVQMIFERACTHLAPPTAVRNTRPDR